ncbi:MAG TPA: HD domain-containing phosphohydrolase [Chthonomonadaceae bacterium]|nr:HD domain-containing phosphohydrolase [Chthonomonadaceae bacterium]
MITTRPPQKTHILVVDDDEWIRDVLVRVLLRNQYQVSAAGSAEEALELLVHNSYDLLICDIMMTGMSGMELLPRVIALYPDLPTVLITAHGDTTMMRQAFRYGACDFIPKPFTIETIPFIIERNLERHALERQRTERHDEAVRWATVQALAAAIDAKEPFTAEHSRRVAVFAVAIAEAMELPRSEVRNVQLAAEVHDVGKIGTPDSILNKPGPLDKEEWELIKQHAEIGAQIVGRIEQLAYVAEIVRHHHEAMNGNGYPDGLKGEEIPLLSRIIAVADAYEVMTSNRVYRTRFSREEAVSRLQAATGEQFDPEVVSAFLSLCPGALPL